MNKKMGKILSVFTLSFCLGLSTVINGGTFHALSSTPSLTASAQTTNATQTNQADELISPTSYEQYLELTTPTDVAVNDGYIAIADGNVIHVYDKTDGVYRSYAHEAYIDESKNHVTKIQFADNGSLFFSDAIPSLHQLNPKTATIDERVTSNLVCSSFLLSGNLIYTGSVASGKSSISKNPLTDLNNSSSLPVVNGIESSAIPILANKEDELFFTKAGDVLYRYLENNPDTREDDEQEILCNFPDTLDSFVITDSVLCCTMDDGFYVYDYTSIVQNRRLPSEALYFKQGNFQKLALYNDRVYAVDGNAVREYSITEGKFTSYEICASSTATNRLNGATDVLFHDDLLITADDGNKRLSVRNENGEYYVIPTATELNGATARFLASTENTVLVCAQSKAYLYDLTTGEKLHVFDFGSNVLTGAVGVYGKYYFTSSGNNGYYVAEKKLPEQNGELSPTEPKWTLSSPATKSGVPQLLASDVYGNLYVVRANQVYRYTAEEFLQTSTGQDLALGTISSAEPIKKLAVDYGGNVYALTASTLLRYEKDSWNETAIPLNQTAVYSDTSAIPLSFTFGVEHNEAYFLYDKDYLFKTDDLNLPTVATIDVNTADENIFNDQSAVFSVVKTKENAILVHFDFETLNGAEYFPYQTLERSSASRTALKIGETDDYYVLAEYDEEERKYQTYLVKASYCEPLSENDYLIEYDQTAGNEKYGYLTNAVNVYKFPYLTSLLTLDKLEKNAKIQILGEITELDHDYYRVKYVTEQGEKTGYVPKAYVLDFDGSTPETEEYVLNGNPADSDAVWRFAYIVCGFLAICILTDYLILRKKPKD